MISFVGAGPGAADLLTLRAADRLKRADVAVWASSLVPAEVLDHLHPGAELHDSAGMTLEDVLAVYDDHPHGRIVRLHSGDLSVYSSIGEQIGWCVSHERAFEIVPGVGSLAAAGAALGGCLTVPGVAQTIVLTRLAGRTEASMPPHHRHAVRTHATADPAATMAVYLSAARPAELQAELLADGHGYPLETPAVILSRVTCPDEQLLTTTVGELADRLTGAGIRTTALVLVGPALARFDDGPRRTRLYDPGYAHGHRKRSRPGTTEGRPTQRRAVR